MGDLVDTLDALNLKSDIPKLVHPNKGRPRPARLSSRRSTEDMDIEGTEGESEAVYEDVVTKEECSEEETPKSKPSALYTIKPNPQNCSKNFCNCSNLNYLSSFISRRKIPTPPSSFLPSHVIAVFLVLLIVRFVSYVNCHADSNVYKITAMAITNNHM